MDRASVRRWAFRQNIRKPARRSSPSAGVRRWQHSQIGSLWQLDASPHAWFPGDERLYPLLDMLDDCSRLIVGARLYERENLLAYLNGG
jgi:transposase InsO family protein